MKTLIKIGVPFMPILFSIFFVFPRDSIYTFRFLMFIFIFFIIIYTLAYFCIKTLLIKKYLIFSILLVVFVVIFYVGNSIFACSNYMNGIDCSPIISTQGFDKTTLPINPILLPQ